MHCVNPLNISELSIKKLEFRRRCNSHWIETSQIETLLNDVEQRFQVQRIIISSKNTHIFTCQAIWIHRVIESLKGLYWKGSLKAI